MNRRLGRSLNTDTRMWEFDDKSGVSIPDEIMKKYEHYTWLSSQGIAGAAMVAIGIIQSYKNLQQQVI